MTSIMSNLPNDIIMRIILQSTTDSNLDYHMERMKSAPSVNRLLGFDGFEITQEDLNPSHMRPIYNGSMYEGWAHHKRPFYDGSPMDDDYISDNEY
jgi:hypothetical protein